MQVTIPNSLSPASAQQQINVLEVNCAAWPTPVVAQRALPNMLATNTGEHAYLTEGPAELRAVANLARWIQVIGAMLLRPAKARSGPEGASDTNDPVLVPANAAKSVLAAA